MQVLLVDDSTTVRTRLAAMLGEVRGVVVHEAASAAEALEQASRTTFDFVVVDLHMPGQSGLELLSALRERAPESGLIVLTNESSDYHRREALARGAIGFLDKSREFQRLGTLLGELVTRRS